MLLKILNLTGGRPVYQIKIQNTILNKISVTNILISIFVCCFTFYSDHVTEEVARSKGDAFRETNNIIRGIVAIIRVRSLFQQPVLALTTYYQSKYTLEFMIKIQKIDEFLLDGGVRVEGILGRIRLVGRIAVIIVFLSIILNIFIILTLFNQYYKYQPTIFDLNMSLLPLTNYLVHVLVVCVYLYAVALRMKSYNIVLRELFLRYLQIEHFSSDMFV